MTAERYPALDAVRGFAVMGILAMNIIAFSMPEAAYLNPLAWGDEGPADLMTWAAAFLLVDGKMRGLFSMLFGASMLLVYQRAQARDGNGAEVHKRRMWTLLGFGLAHYYLIWSGDILALYAACGLLGMMLLEVSDRSRLIIAATMFTLSLAIYAAIAVYIASEPDGSAMLRTLGADGPTAFSGEVAIYRGGYDRIITDRIVRDGWGPIELAMIYGLETIGLMALGMVLLRNGFLTGAWEMARYRRFAAIAYAVGIPPTLTLLVWAYLSGFDTRVTVGSQIAWSTPFRLAIVLGHAALAMMAWKAFTGSAVMTRIEAVGRAAFSNYLGTSLIMTTLFYGYGFGLFGMLSRWQAYLVCIPVWALMLLWSKPWLDRFQFGPMEWLWRSAARGSWQRRTTS